MSLFIPEEKKNVFFPSQSVHKDSINIVFVVCLKHSDKYIAHELLRNDVFFSFIQIHHFEHNSIQ